MEDAKLIEMFTALAARLDPNVVWDTNQQAVALREAGYTEEEVNDFFEEAAPF
jgi:hypothetical protein